MAGHRPARRATGQLDRRPGWIVAPDARTDDRPASPAAADALDGAPWRRRHPDAPAAEVAGRRPGRRRAAATQPGAVGRDTAGRAVVSLLAARRRPPTPVDAAGCPSAVDRRPYAWSRRSATPGSTAPLWCVTTRRGVAVDRSRTAARRRRPGSGASAGSLALELPGRWGGLVDLPDDVDARRLAGSRRAGADGGEDQVAVRAAGVLGPAAGPLRRSPAAADRRLAAPRHRAGHRRHRRHSARTSPAGSLDQGAEQLVLASRRGPDAPGAADLVAELAGPACEVTVAPATSPTATRSPRCSTGIGDDLTAVVHAAGVLDDAAPLDATSLDDFAAVCRAKVRGAAHLDELLARPALDAFVLFSSVAGVWGSAGQGAYARRQRLPRRARRTSAAPGPGRDLGRLGRLGRRRHGRRARPTEQLLRAGHARRWRRAWPLGALQQALDHDDEPPRRRRRRLGPVRPGLHRGPAPARCSPRSPRPTGPRRSPRRTRPRDTLRAGRPARRRAAAACWTRSATQVAAVLGYDARHGRRRPSGRSGTSASTR